MPNWCGNRLSINGLTETQQNELVEAILAEQLLETFIPVPEDVEDYSYRCDAWGTKWDVGGEVEFNGEELVAYFNSAWCPPIEGLDTISRLFPEASFRLAYDEPGMAYCGVTYFNNGEVEDNYINYSDIPGVEELDFESDDDEAVFERLESLVEEWINDK